MRIRDVQVWVVRRPLPGMWGHKSPGYFQITGHTSLELAVQHVKELLAAGALVQGVYDRANRPVMDEDAIRAQFATPSTPEILH